jgi:hypothetical protein
MTTVYDEILATIERRALTDGVPLDALDAHTADVLRIPRDHYAAWQLVCGAITSYAHANSLTPAGPRPRAATVAEQLSRLWEQLGAVHQAAVSGADREVVQARSRELIGELFVLTEWLLAEPDTQPEWPADGADQGVARG